MMHCDDAQDHLTNHSPTDSIVQALADHRKGQLFDLILRRARGRHLRDQRCQAIEGGTKRLFHHLRENIRGRFISRIISWVSQAESSRDTICSSSREIKKYSAPVASKWLGNSIACAAWHRWRICRITSRTNRTCRQSSNRLRQC